MLVKTANTQYKLNELIFRRYSPRTFEPETPPKEVLMRIFEAVRWAPSSMNDQPWKILAGTKGTETYEKIFDSLVDFNRKWAKLAPVLVVICGNTISAKTGKENPAFRHDCGQAAAYLTFQAMEEGLYCHQMGGYDKEKIIKAFQLSTDLEPVVVIALGFPGKPEYLDEIFRKMELSERVRKPLDEIVSLDY